MVPLKLLGDDGGGLAEPASAGQIRWTLSKTRAFDEFSLYWLGESYQGLPLTDDHPIQVRSAAGNALALPPRTLSFSYTGIAHPGSEEGCPAPLMVRVEPNCSLALRICSPRRLRLGPPWRYGASGVTAGRCGQSTPLDGGCSYFRPLIPGRRWAESSIRSGCRIGAGGLGGSACGRSFTVASGRQVVSSGRPADAAARARNEALCGDGRCTFTWAFAGGFVAELWGYRFIAYYRFRLRGRDSGYDPGHRWLW